MSKFTTALQAYGLSLTEARVYEAGLKEGEVTVSQLSQELSLNRATTYHAVHELATRGLLKKRTENGTLIISMIRNDVDSFFLYEEKKLQERKESLHYFFKHLPAPKKKEKTPDVEYFSGFDGVRMALEIALRAKSHHWDIIAPKNNFFSEIDEDYSNYYLLERKRRKITSRSLWENSEKRTTRIETIKERNPRYIPKQHQGSFHSILILFDKKALFISSAKEMQATLINSPSIYSTLQMQFNALWDISETAKAH